MQLAQKNIARIQQLRASPVQSRRLVAVRYQPDNRGEARESQPTTTEQKVPGPDGQGATPPVPPQAVTDTPITVAPPGQERVADDFFGFKPVPEIINGRLAMLGFVAAVAAEITSGHSVFRQLADSPRSIAMTFILFAIASAVPAFFRAQSPGVGPFTPKAEIVNGRLAMVGFFGLVVAEFFRNGIPLF